MTGVLSSISVETAQSGHIFLGTQHTGHNNAMKRNVPDIETIEESAADVMQQNGCTRHQIGNALMKGVNMIERRSPYVNQFALAMLSIGTIGHGQNTPTPGSRQLYSIGVGKGCLIVRNRTYAVRTSLSITKQWMR